ncbi:MAG: ABC transporter ATP-binding protein [Deltaproteobacteria bacterium]|nr:ABC transporter ATP-binding protein [Deltaproteobacteria bacterium]
MASITLTAIAKTFGIVNVLQDVSLAVADGEFVALLGPSGCGKSTLIRIVAGLETPDAGEVRIGERVVDGPRVHVPPEERGLGMVFQSYAVWPHKTVLGNVVYPLRLRGMDRTDAAEKAARALDLVQLTGLRCAIPTSSRAASSAWRSAGRSSASRRCSSSTSRSRTSTRGCARRCAASSPSCVPASGSRCCSSPTTRARPSPPPTGWR